MKFEITTHKNKNPYLTDSSLPYYLTFQRKQRTILPVVPLMPRGPTFCEEVLMKNVLTSHFTNYMFSQDSSPQLMNIFMPSSQTTTLPYLFHQQLQSYLLFSFLCQTLQGKYTSKFLCFPLHLLKFNIHSHRLYSNLPPKASEAS